MVKLASQPEKGESIQAFLKVRTILVLQINIIFIVEKIDFASSRHFNFNVEWGIIVMRSHHKPLRTFKMSRQS
jgi:hypothetical protein